MLPMSVTRLRLGALLATDTTTLNQAANALKMRLFQNNYAPNDGSLIGNFTESTFDGYGAISLALGPQVAFVDPVTGQQGIQIVPPAGGWVYTCSGGAAEPQTIYGYYLTDKTGTVVYAAQALPVPVVMTGAGQQIDLGKIDISILLAPMY